MIKEIGRITFLNWSYQDW